MIHNGEGVDAMVADAAAIRRAIGAKIRRARRARRWSQSQLARALNHASGGCVTDAHYVSRWERGERRPGYDWQPVIESVLDLDLDQTALEAEEGSESVRSATPVCPSPEPIQVMDSQVSEDGHYGEREHLGKALQDAGRYLDESVAYHFQRQLDQCIADDGAHGPTSALPIVLSIVGVVERYAREVKPSVRRRLLNVGARGAEFAGWLYRDAYRPDRALYWRDRAVEWSQESGDWSMQGYILLKKSQSAWDERDGLRMLTLAQSVQAGPWKLSPLVQAEAAQQEARGLAMVGESAHLINRKLDEAWELFGSADDRHRQSDQLGCHYSENLLTMQSAICYCEAGEPLKAVEAYRGLIAQERFSYRDRGYFLSLMASALAAAKEPSGAIETGYHAMHVARQTKSQRTIKELERMCQLLEPWRGQSSVRDLRSAVLTGN